MFEGLVVGGVLLMGGTGARFGSPIPKQFHLLGGRPVFSYALETMIRTGFFDEIVLVCHADWITKAANDRARVVAGGTTRQASSRIGVHSFTQPVDLILIHDAVRPFVSERILKENLERAKEVGAADTCIPSADTLVYAPDRKNLTSIPKREEFLRGQTPQTFRADWIREAHERSLGLESTDDCRLVLENGRRVSVVFGEEQNFKITTEWDLWIAEQFLEQLRLSAGNAALTARL